MVTIKRQSPITGQWNAMDIPLSNIEYLAASRRWESGEYIQNAFPTLSADQREFIKTGITPAEWDIFFGEDD